MRRLVSLSTIAFLFACTESPTTPDRPITAVDLTPATNALVLGQTLKLKATVTGGFGTPTVKWVSSVPAIATVTDSGLVTALGTGSVIITATAGEVTASRTIAITPGAVDRVAVCDQATPTQCVSSVTLGATGTSVVARASAFNAIGTDITSSCVFTWTPNVNSVVTISFLGDATRRDALITRTNEVGNLSIVIACGGRPGIFTIGGGVAPPAPPTTP